MLVSNSFRLDAWWLMSLLFVHIAKSGGTSLRRLLKSNKGIFRFDCFHNGSLRFIDGHCVERIDADLNALDKYDVAVVALRHPCLACRVLITIFCRAV